MASSTTTHHCDTCTCTSTPDLTAALNVAARLDLRGAYSVTVTPAGIVVQGDRSDVAPIIERLGAELSHSYTLDGVDYVIHTVTANDIRVRITSVEHAAVTA